MQELRGPLEQIRGQVAGLIVHPTGRVSNVDLPSGAGNFDDADAVQDHLDFGQVAFRQHQKEIIVSQPRREIRAAAGSLQAAGKLLQGRVHRREAVALIHFRKIVKMNGSQAERGILAPRAGNLFSKLLLDKTARMQSRDGIDAGRIGILCGGRVRGGVLPG